MWRKEFDSTYVGFMKDGAQWLVDNTDIKLVGELKFCTYSALTHYHVEYVCLFVIESRFFPGTIIN